MHVAVWETGELRQQYPKLEQDLAADVAVVGGGMAGISTAACLAEAGKSVIVLEAGRIGSGATGHSSGNLYATVSRRLHRLAAHWGIERARRVVQARSAAIDLIERNVSFYRLRCDFARQPWVLYSTEGLEEESADIEAEFAAARVAGLEARLALDLPLPYLVRKALVIRRQAQMHPLQYVRGMAQALSARGCRIFESSRVTTVDLAASCVHVNGQRIRASDIVLATHAPIGMPNLQARIHACRSYAVAAPVERDQLPGGMFFSTGAQPRATRTLHLGADSWIVMDGSGFPGGRQHGPALEYLLLEAGLQSRFHAGEVQRRWSSLQYVPADGLPVIGRLSAGAHVYVATGFDADGLVYGSLAGMLIADEICGRANPWEGLFSPARFNALQGARDVLRKCLPRVQGS